MTPGQWSLLSPCPQKQKTTKNKKQGHIAPDNIAPRVIRALKPLHHVKVAVQGGEHLVGSPKANRSYG